MAKGSGVSWRGGKDLRYLRLRVHDRADDLRARSVEALEKTIEEGAWELQDLLEAAVTKTGQRRAEERGGLPGRHDTGNMVGSISFEVRGRRAKRVSGVFGWWGANFEQYFKDQDLGEGSIPAARALPRSYFRARERFRQRMYAVVRGKSAN